MKVLTDLSGESPEVDIDFQNGTKISIYRSPVDGLIRIHVDEGPEGVEDRPVYAYDAGYR